MAQNPAQRLSAYQAAKEELSARYLRPSGVTLAIAQRTPPTPQVGSNVVGVGIGEKLSEGRPTGVLALKILVRHKFALNQIARRNLLPEGHSGFPVDIEEVGLIRPFMPPPAMPNPKTKFRPAQPGSSCGFQDPANAIVMAGTFGALVRDAAGLYVLSNNHVLADE